MPRAAIDEMSPRPLDTETPVAPRDAGAPAPTAPGGVPGAGRGGGLIPFAYRHRRAILFTIAVVTLLGVYAAFQLPTALFPSITFPRIVVLADNGEQPIERMMIEVTRPLEEAAR